MTMRKKCPPHEIPTRYKTALSKPHLRGFTEPLTPRGAVPVRRQDPRIELPRRALRAAVSLRPKRFERRRVRA